MDPASGPRSVAVDRYEDLRVWQEARGFCSEIGSLIRRRDIRGDFELRDQLNAAALSTMANIAEGFLRRRPKEFAHFVRVAGASNGEARALLYAAQDRGYLSAEESARLVAMTNAIGKMLRGLLKALDDT